MESRNGESINIYMIILGFLQVLIGEWFSQEEKYTTRKRSIVVGLPPARQICCTSVVYTAGARTKWCADGILTSPAGVQFHVPVILEVLPVTAQVDTPCCSAHGQKNVCTNYI
jgi:hypothetical protein